MKASDNMRSWKDATADEIATDIVKMMEAMPVPKSSSPMLTHAEALQLGIVGQMLPMERKF